MSKIDKVLVMGTISKLHPYILVKNPVLFVLYIVCCVATAETIKNIVTKDPNSLFESMLTLLLWINLMISLICDALAERQGKATASHLKNIKSDIVALKRDLRGNWVQVSANTLKKMDIVKVLKGQIIPADGTVIEGVASVDESAVTGESAPVIREAGGDRSAVTAGTTVLSDELWIEISKNPGDSFLDRMILLVEGSARTKTPNEIALNILLSCLTLIFLWVCICIQLMSVYLNIHISIISTLCLFVCLMPTTIGSLLSVVGIAGMNRLMKYNVLAMSSKAVDAAGDVDYLVLDKTGTITLGNRMASELVPAPNKTIGDIVSAAFLSSMDDRTPEGRSIIELVKNYKYKSVVPETYETIPFSAQTCLSGIDTPEVKIRKGSVWAICKVCGISGDDELPKELLLKIQHASQQGSTPLLVANNKDIIGMIVLKDIIKPGIRDRFERIRAMGIRSIMVTGDNPLTAEAIAKEAGVDEFIAQAKPEDKLHLIKSYQEKGHMIAMSGDGTNDAPALAQSNIGLAMNTGTQAAREAANMLDLDSDPTKIIEIVEIGKQLLITRGALTTFSIANDIAKYFVVLPALFIPVVDKFKVLNVLKLSSTQSALMSSLIFNGGVILLLLPLALQGVYFKPQTNAQLLKKNILVYGLGGAALPFVVIKMIDLIASKLMQVL
jgi:K+-transporting ATPase ATPase B chain